LQNASFCLESCPAILWKILGDGGAAWGLLTYRLIKIIYAGLYLFYRWFAVEELPDFLNW
jgi:hypothetical protein